MVLKKLAYLLVIILMLTTAGAETAYAQAEIVLSVSEHTQTSVSAGRRYLDLGDTAAGYEMINGDFVEFMLEVPQSGQYEILIRAASLGVESIVTVDGDLTLRQTVDTGNFLAFQKISMGYAELETGTHTIRVATPQNAVQSLHLKDLIAAESQVVLPKRITQLVGQCTHSNVPEAQRYADGSGPYGWGMSPDTYVEFTVMIEKAAKYAVKLDIGSVGDDISVLADGRHAGTVMVETGHFDALRTVDCGVADLNAGIHIIKISTGSINGNGLHLRKLILEESGEYEEQLIIHREFEDYNPGGQNVGYYDTTDGVDYEWCIDRGDDVEVGEGASGLIVSMAATEWMRYDIDVPKTGKYMLTCSYSYGAEDAGATAVFSCGAQQLRCSYGFSGGWHTYKNQAAGSLFLEEGTQTLTFLLESGGISLDYFNLEWVGSELSLKTLSANGEVFEADAEIPCSTDVLELTFSDVVRAESVTDESVVLKGENAWIPLALTVSEEKVTAALTQALIKGQRYELFVTGMTDQDGLLSLSDITVGFTAGSGVQNGAALADVSYTMQYEHLEVSGKVLSSAGIGIGGRTVRLQPIGSTQTAATVSGSDGAFRFNYEMPAESVAGQYAFVVLADYANENVTVTALYVSRLLEQDILKALSETQNAEEAREVLEAREADLGLNMAAELADIRDKSKIYQGFAGKQFESITQLRDSYYTRIAVEQLRQAQNSREAEALLAQKAFCDALGIDAIQLRYIVGGRQSMLRDMLAIPAETEDAEVKQRVSELVHNYLLAEYGKEGVQLALSDISLYTGQIGSVKLTLNKTLEDVTAVLLVFQCDEETVLKNMRFTPADSICADTSSANKQFTVRLTGDGLKKVNSLGALTVSSSTAVNSHIQAKGTVQYGLDLPFVLQSDLPSCVAAVSVSENQTKGSGSGGGSSAAGSFGGAAASGSGGAKPPKQNEMYEFNDMEHSTWAKEAVYYLLNKQVLSKAEDGRFRPQDSVTREEFVKMLVVALGTREGRNAAAFTDTGKGAWYDSYIADAVQAGLVNGYADGSFGVGRHITREDMAVMISRALQQAGHKISEESGALFEDDAEIGDYAKDAVYMMRALRLTDGTGANRFEPKGTATRAMAAKMVYEMMKAVGV